MKLLTRLGMLVALPFFLLYFGLMLVMMIPAMIATILFGKVTIKRSKGK